MLVTPDVIVVFPPVPPTFCIRVIVPAPVLVGAVRNCQHLGGRQHRIGVEFIEKAAAEAEAEDAA